MNSLKPLPGVFSCALALGATLVASGAWGMCYSVHDEHDTLIYRSQQAPVSMSTPSLSDAVQRRFPGGQLSISSEAPCFHLDLTSAEGRALAAAQQQQRSAAVVSAYASMPTVSVHNLPARATSRDASSDAQSRDQSSLNLPAGPRERIIETRTEVVYVPVIQPVPEGYSNYSRHHPKPLPPSTPTAPASVACGDRGFYSFCADGSRANTSGNFAFGTDGRLKTTQPQPATPRGP